MNIEEFNTEFLRFKDAAYRYAVAILHDRSAAEEATQDLYEKLWRRRLFIRHARFKSLLLIAMRNICLDVVRQRSRERERFVAESHNLPDNEDFATQELSANDMAQIARRLIATLPEREAEVMHLRDCEGLEFSEIAAITHQSEAAVRMALSRARQRVKQQLLKRINNGQ